MIQARLQISGQINGREKLSGGLNTSIKEIKPELENIKIIPKTEQQEFKSEKYGYDKIIVEPVTSSIDEDIKPENIKKGTNILGVEGGYEGIDTSDATATSNDILVGKTAYANNTKIEGTIEEYDGSSIGGVIEENIISDASYLFYKNARMECFDKLLSWFQNITSTSYMFSYNDISNVPYFDTNTVIDMSRMFDTCKNLISIPTLNVEKVNNIYSMFSYSGTPKFKNFTTFGGLKDLGKAYTQKSNNYMYYKLDLGSCNFLTHDSLMNVINNLYDLNMSYNVAGGETLYTQSLNLGSTNLAKLTAEEIAIATAKGWTVS